MDITETRRTRIAETVDRVRKIEADQGITRESLADIRAALIDLADPNLFPFEHFPVGDGRADKTFVISEDPDGRFALYVCTGGECDEIQPHNHKTWACIAGLHGCERNRVFDAEVTSDDPLRISLTESRTLDIVPGEALALMPLDIHNIRFVGKEPTMTLHMYGTAIDRIDDRAGYDLESGVVNIYPPADYIERPPMGT